MFKSVVLASNEIVFEIFVRRLQSQFLRDPGQYEYTMYPAAQLSPQYFEKYFLSANYTFTKTGLSLLDNEPKPFRICEGSNGYVRPIGIYWVHPGTEHEIILYLYKEDVGRSSEIIVAYKNRRRLLELVAGLKAYAKTQKSIIEFPSGRTLPKPAISWDDVILPEELKSDIMQNIEAFLDGKEFFDALEIPYKRGLLFVGPPGNGKTLICKAISANTALPFVYFKCDKKMDNHSVDSAFQLAEDLAPAGICFEDLDSLFNGGISMSHFLNKLDGFECRTGLLILATTNHPERIDPALKNRPSRFDRVWILDNPNSECRNRYLRRFLPSALSDSFIEGLAAQTKGFSMAYLKELHVSASFLALKKGLPSPAEEDYLEAIRLLTSQFKSAKRDFESEVDMVLGFGRERVPS